MSPHGFVISEVVLMLKSENGEMMILFRGINKRLTALNKLGEIGLDEQQLETQNWIATDSDTWNKSHN
jgi:hypothetical protein